uniref:Uncharacterized protein n=1 Tax=Chenopodium quinoa TaxID=63459 RepID=A0A803N671_CHEQI
MRVVVGMQLLSAPVANVHYKTISEIRFDLLKNGFLQSYTLWDKHGEKQSELSDESEASFADDEDMIDMLQVGYGVVGMRLHGNDHRDEDTNIQEAESSKPTKEVARFYRLLDDYKEPLVIGG